MRKPARASQRTARSAAAEVKRLRALLTRLQKRRALVAVHRAAIDDWRVSGLVLDFSDDLILMVDAGGDFFVDGYRIIATKDISQLDFGECERWYGHILREEGLIPDLGPTTTLDLSSWRSALVAFERERRNIIVENESPKSERFLIGRVERLGPKSVTICSFDPVGNWLYERKRIDYAEITSIRFECNYLKLHSKYLRRPDPPAP